MKSIYGANNNVPEDEFFIRTRAIVRVACACLVTRSSIPQPQWAYKRWISYLLNRVNVYTKVAYKNEPTILAWNVINEPTISYQFDKKRGLPTGSTLRTWVNDMIEHIRVKEQAKQLVFVGDVRGYAVEILLQQMLLNRSGSAPMPRETSPCRTSTQATMVVMPMHTYAP